jgi:hypothetical protein
MKLFFTQLVSKTDITDYGVMNSGFGTITVQLTIADL